MTRTSAEQILHTLVEIPTVTFDRDANNNALDYIGDFLREQDMHVVRRSYMETLGDGEERRELPYDVLIATTTPTKTPKVMLSAHVDVVPAPDSMFKVRRSGDKLMGRGTSDMKSSIAAFMELTRRLKNKGVLKDYDYGITIVSNEERAGRGVENTLNDGYLPKVVILPDNGNNWDMERIAKGAWTITVDAPGVAAHGSRPWNGDSATMRLLDALDEIRGMFVGQGPETDSLNVSKLRAGTAQNMVPNRAQATLDIRYMGKASLKQIRDKVAEICVHNGVSHDVIGFFPAVEHDMDNEFIREFRRSIKAVTGKTSGDVISTGACDAAYYDQRGVTTIVTRPPGGGEHGLDEWVSREGFLQLVDVLGHFIKKACKIAA